MSKIETSRRPNPRLTVEIQGRDGPRTFEGVRLNDEGLVEVPRYQLEAALGAVDRRREPEMDRYLWQVKQQIGAADADRNGAIDRREAENLPTWKGGLRAQIEARLGKPPHPVQQAVRDLRSTFDQIEAAYAARLQRIEDGSAARETLPRLLEQAGMADVVPVSFPFGDVYARDDRLLIHFPTGMTVAAQGLGEAAAASSVASWDQEGTLRATEGVASIAWDAERGQLTVGRDLRHERTLGPDSTSYDLRAGSISVTWGSWETHRIERGEIAKVAVFRSSQHPRYEGEGVFRTGEERIGSVWYESSVRGRWVEVQPELVTRLPIWPEVFGRVPLGPVPRSAIAYAGP